MLDYIFLMHDDSPPPQSLAADDPWGPYIEKLQGAGCFQGGSAVGGGVCVNKRGTAVEISRQIVGFIKVRARSLDDARQPVAGNPVFEAGGTVEIRELPRT